MLLAWVKSFVQHNFDLTVLNRSLPSIPAKRYFTIGEVSSLCGVKPHVLRYWEQEFTQLRPMKRRGNRRYYQLHEVLMIRRIRELLYNQGFTIVGARHQLQETSKNVASPVSVNEKAVVELDETQQRVPPQVFSAVEISSARLNNDSLTPAGWPAADVQDLMQQLRCELKEIRQLLE